LSFKRVRTSLDLIPGAGGQIRLQMERQERSGRLSKEDNRGGHVPSVC
jgi:hypothetical protein